MKESLESCIGILFLIWAQTLPIPFSVTKNPVDYDAVNAKASPISERSDALFWFPSHRQGVLWPGCVETLPYAKEHNIDTAVMTKPTRMGRVRLIGSVIAYMVKYSASLP